jgi:hypothetical protein
MRLTIKAGKVESATGIRRHDKQTEQFYSVTEREWIEMEGIHEARREGRKLAEAVADILRPELAKLNQEARDEFWRLLFEAAKKRWKPRDEPPNPQRPKESLLPPGYVAPSIDTSVGKVTFQNNDAPAARKPTDSLPQGSTAQRMAEAKNDAIQALRLVEDICDLAESGDIPTAGRDYAESVAERARSIGETIEERGRVTEAQVNALENMLSGLERWIR